MRRVFQQCFICVRSRLQLEGLCKMASSRVKFTLSVEQCEILLKDHVASLDDQIYKNEDLEVVVKHYLQFLCACAQYTLRLNSKVVQQAAVSIFGIPPTGAKMFAEAMVLALQYCMSKGKCASSGKKLSDSVKSVVLSFRGAGSLVAVQRALQGSSSMGSSSSSTLRLPYLKSQDKEEESPSAAPSTKRGATDMVTAADIYKIYGMCPPPQKKKMLQDNDVHEIVSSQEVLASQESTSGRKQEEEHAPANKKPQQVALLANIYVACRGSVE